MPSTDTAAIRAWAQANGHPVGDRGRLPAELVSAYQSAQSPPAGGTAGKPAAKKGTKAVPRAARTTAPKKATKAPARVARVATVPATVPAKVATVEPVKIVTDDLPPAPAAPAASPSTPTPTPTPATQPAVATVTSAPTTVESRLAAVEAKLTETLRRLEALETAPKRKFGRRG